MLLDPRRQIIPILLDPRRQIILILLSIDVSQGELPLGLCLSDFDLRVGVLFVIVTACVQHPGHHENDRCAGEEGNHGVGREDVACGAKDSSNDVGELVKELQGIPTNTNYDQGEEKSQFEAGQTEVLERFGRGLEIGHCSFSQFR